MKIQALINPLPIIFFAVLLRLLPHPPNFAPITALALFGGAYVNKKYALVVPLFAMFLSDLIIGFHDTMIFVYGSFLLAGLIGVWLRHNKTVFKVAGAAFFSSIVFFLVTNFGVWLVSEMYPPTFEGLLKAYYFAIPFFRNTLIGDLFYTGLFFGSFELLYSVLKKRIYVSNIVKSKKSG